MIHRHEKKTIQTSQAPSAIGPYSQGISFGHLTFTSGQLGLNPATGEIPATIEEQTRQCLLNVKAVLEESGTSLDKVIKATVFLKDMDDFAAVNAVYATFFTEGSYPARSAVQVARLPKDALVEIEVVAVNI
ncbi:RidA family protein [Parasphaerochaeta coccoides]|nr:RidA family protein [Parasphaerochaeta coccoides]